MIVTRLSAGQVARRLLEASTVGDVEEILEGLPGKRWQPFGGKAGNWAQINALSDPSDAVVERVTNGFDALVEREVGLSGRTGLTSPRQATEALFGIPGGRIANVKDDDKRRRLAQQLIVTMRESGTPKQPTIVVYDEGIGQHPNDFPKTLVSLNEENKRTRLYLTGAYGWGGASSLQFARYTIFVSRRNLGLLGEGQGDLVGWTIVRYNPLDEDMYSKHGVFEYLTLEDGDQELIPRFAPDDLPITLRNWTGTVCTCVQYELSRYSDAVARPSDSLFLMFNSLLFDPILPFLVKEARPRWMDINRTASEDGLVINGSAARLAWDKPRKGKRGVEYTNSWSVPLNGSGSTTVRYWILKEKGDAQKDWQPIETYANPEQAVTITHNGQRQGSWRRELFNQLGLLTLSKFMLVQVDCDALSWQAKRALFTTTRDRLKDNPLTAQLREAVATALRSDKYLTALDRRRKEGALSRRNAEHAEKIRRLLKKAIETQRQGDAQLYRRLLSSNPELPIYTDQPLVKPEPREEQEEVEQVEAGLEYGDEPTELRVLNPIVQIPAEGKAVVRLFLNARDGYISPMGGQGQFAAMVTRGQEDFRMVGYSELRNGHMRCTISAQGARVGDRGRVVFTVSTPDGPPLVDEADLVAVESPVKRARKTDKTGPVTEQGPNVVDVHRDEWDKFDLSATRVARVEQNSPGPGQTTFYVNWDYPPLDDRLMAEKKATEEEIIPYKRKFSAAMAYTAWMQEAEAGSGVNGGGFTQEARDDELRRAARMFLFSEFLKDRDT